LQVYCPYPVRERDAPCFARVRGGPFRAGDIAGSLGGRTDAAWPLALPSATPHALRPQLCYTFC